MCKDSPTCSTFAKGTAVFEAISDANCEMVKEINCPSTFEAIALDSCKKSGQLSCYVEYLKKNVKSSDPCWPCFSSLISPLIIYFSLLYAFYF